MRKKWQLCCGVLGVLMLFGMGLAQPCLTQAGDTGGITQPQVSSYHGYTDQLIVKHRDPSVARAAVLSSTHIDSLSASAGLRLKHFRAMSGDAHVLKLPHRMTLAEAEKVAKRLNADPTVEYAEPDRLMFPLLSPNDPLYANQWHYMTPTTAPDNYQGGVNLPGAWDITTGSNSIVVAVIDSGIVVHADLAGRTVPGYNFISDPTMAGNGIGRTPDPSDLGDWVEADLCYLGSPASNSSWHGTHVAGTIGAATNNNTGVAGINWISKILPVRVLGKCAGYRSGYESDVVDGARWAAGQSVSGVPDNANPAKVLNLSLGTQGPCSATVQTAINDAIAAGVTVVAGAGNTSSDVSTFTPANCNGVISVTAVNRAGGRAYYSNFGTIVKIAAPGGEYNTGDPNGVLSTLNSGTTSPAASPGGDIYQYYQGTSMATAHVSGIVSLMLSQNNKLTSSQVLSLIQTTARAFPIFTGSVGGDCTTSICGAGIIDARAAVALATPDPTYAWHTFYGSDSYPNAVAVDGGDVYVTGTSSAAWNGPSAQAPLNDFNAGLPGGRNSFVLKIDSSGKYQWHTFYGSGSDSRGIGIAVDSSGNLYVTGVSIGFWNGPSAEAPLNAYSWPASSTFVLKLDRSGTYQWHTFYGGTFDQDPSFIAVDGSGNVFVTGTSRESWNGPPAEAPLNAFSGWSDIFVLKLNGSGTYQWHTFYGSIYGDTGSSITLDGSNVYVMGSSSASWNGPSGQAPLNSFSGADKNISVIKLNGSGTYQWHTFYAIGSGSGKSMAVDSNGDIYMAGYSNATWNGPSGEVPLNAYNSGSDIFVLKLNSSGTYKWHTFYGGSSLDVASSISVGGGNVFVTGYSYQSWNGPAGQMPRHPYSNSSGDIFTLKLSLSGVYQWHTFYGSGSPAEEASGIAVDGCGNMYVTGWSGSWKGPCGAEPIHACSGSNNIFVLKLTESSLYADFAGAGIWKWDGNNWSQLTPNNPQFMSASGSLLYGNFGTGAGIWKWDGVTWSQITPNAPTVMSAAGLLLYGNFGVGAGIWRWDGSNWNQITPNPPTGMAAAGSLLYGNFGNLGAGIWKRDGTTWSQLTPNSPIDMMALGSLLYGNFGAGAGIWKWDGTTWSQLTPNSPTDMVALGSLLYGNFGTGAGIWKWDGSSWSQVTPNAPQGMSASGSLLYGDFGTGGIWKWDGSVWSQVTPNNPISIKAGF